MRVVGVVLHAEPLVTVKVSTFENVDGQPGNCASTNHATVPAGKGMDGNPGKLVESAVPRITAGEPLTWAKT